MLIRFWVVSALLIETSAFADGDDRTPPDAKKSDSTILNDDRLPPVLPGEEVGPKEQRIKVWSSSGPVPSTMLEEAKNPKNADLPGVIVDTRQ
jgi:hypothetical protein